MQTQDPQTQIQARIQAEIQTEIQTETLPLFPGLASPPRPASAPTTPQGDHLRDAGADRTTLGDLTSEPDHHSAERAEPGPRQILLNGFEPAPEASGSAATGPDYHMAIAWRLSRAMKGVTTGHRSARSLRRLTPGQRHQVGNVICGHLLASLRAQVEAEASDS